MTRNEVKEKLQETCRQNRKILDVFFYKVGSSQQVVVVAASTYASMQPDISSYNFDSIEKALVFFYDARRLGTIDMDPSVNTQSVDIPTLQLGE